MDLGCEALNELVLTSVFGGGERCNGKCERSYAVEDTCCS